MTSELCRTAGCIETPVAGDDLCSRHHRYVREVADFIDGTAAGVTFDSCRIDWGHFLAEAGLTLLPLDGSGRQVDGDRIRREQVE